MIEEDETCPCCDGDIVGLGGTTSTDGKWFYMCNRCGPSEPFESEKDAANTLFAHYDMTHKAHDIAIYERKKDK